MSRIVFHALGRKFLQREEDMPADDNARQVIYQTLALGHHIGVIDCLQPRISCPEEGYAEWLAALPEGEARRKLAGVLRFGEIMIDASHAALLALALSRGRDAMSERQRGWSDALMRELAAMDAEPALYLMVKRHED
ncbi:formate hydrogenlyase maturation protein HycH [Chromobacterium phragmitis]|uniref:Formate hydrogenlyase maturation protein HycH n=1 Tax=Chromobacterium phragmitis TaxID=2202141 RepID=A0A344ULQ3_9NEIS|nr:formate hydrogenlyase maturation protein HycH [Chromobacterium phragmitis]AXE30825.1 formate hydrogenlyase maturation protein HycH [Chromobacterium phragmitis]AXE36201.1 formate hydrogenlyase maturation protein HycH [Chromobacterium phragmitis]